MIPVRRRAPAASLLLVLSLALTALVAACGGNENSNAAFAGIPVRAATATPTPDDLPGVGYPSNGNAHVQPGEAHGAYFSNPPTSGWHFAELPQPGIYTTPLTPEDVPHFLEHGGVWVLYNCPTACPDLVNQLIPIVNRATQARKPVALAPYPSMSARIAVVAWQRLLTLDAVDEAKIQEFIDKLVCRYNPEGPGYCPNTAGTLEPPREAARTPTPRPSPTPPPGVKQYATPPAMQIDPSKTYVATITTPRGVITVQLDPRAAPVTVNNFVFLAREGFYDGLTFHRVEPGFVIQGGDPRGDGTGGPGYTIPDEKSPLKHEEGAIAMAKSALPNSAGSQFYITLAPQPALDGNYTVFGKVIEGMNVVKQIQRGDRITRVTIEER